MRLPSGTRRPLAILLLGAAALAGCHGPTGATTEYGGSIEARQLPDFPSIDAARWVNGEPTPLSKLRGEVVFVEAWAPA
jgi:hypothetical protein